MYKKTSKMVKKKETGINSNLLSFKNHEIYPERNYHILHEMHCSEFDSVFWSRLPASNLKFYLH